SATFKRSRSDIASRVGGASQTILRITTILWVVACCVVAWAGGVEGNSSGRLVVRRPAVATPTSTARASEVLARQSAIQQARIDHWRSLPHHLSTPSVDWSPRANRRVGWRAPAQPMRNPHEPDPLKGPAALARA